MHVTGGRRWQVETVALLASAVAFYTIPWAPLYVLSITVFAVAAWRRLETALAVVILFAPFFMLPKQVGTHPLPPSEVILAVDALVFAGWALWPGTRSRLDWAALWHSPYLPPLALLVVATGMSTALAARPHQAFQWYDETVMQPAVFFLMLTVLRGKLEDWLTRYGTLALAGLVVSGIGIGQWITGHGVNQAGFVESVYGSPDNLGLFLDRVIPLCVSGVVFVRLKQLRRGIAAATLILILALFLSRSRGAEAAVAVTVLALAIVWNRRAVWLVAALAVVAIAGVAMKENAIQNALTSGHSGTVQERQWVWQSSIRMIVDHPMFGVGPDNFIHYYAPVHQAYLPCEPGEGYMNPAAWHEPCLSHPHDEALDFWLTGGLAGLAAFLWIEVVFWSQILALIRRSVAWWRVLAIGSGGAMLAALLHGLVDNSYFLIDLSIVFWLLCAGVATATNSVDAEARA